MNMADVILFMGQSNMAGRGDALLAPVLPLGAEDTERVIMGSKQLAEFASKGLMKDSYHYRQEGYNLIGDEAGEHAGNYLQEQYKKTRGSD